MTSAATFFNSIECLLSSRFIMIYLFPTFVLSLSLVINERGSLALSALRRRRLKCHRSGLTLNETPF